MSEHGGSLASSHELSLEFASISDGPQAGYESAGITGAAGETRWTWPSAGLVDIRRFRLFAKSHAHAGAVLWLLTFAAAQYLFSFPHLALTVPHTALRLISIPLALFAVALMLRPAREAPAYAAIFAVVNVSRAIDTPHLSFTVARVLIEAGQMMFIVWLLYRHFHHRLKDPLVLAAWSIAVLGVTAVSALLIVVAAVNLPIGDGDYLPMLGGSLGVAWRYWWLGNACAFLTIAGPIATLVILRQRLRILLTTPGRHRRRFIGVTIGLVLTSLFAFPVFDMSWRGFSPDLLLALQLLPVPFAMALATRYRANGAAVAILTFSLIAAYSVAGPASAANWRLVPMPATPAYALLLVTASTCMVVAGISRQLKIALNDALEASQAKSRFIAMLNHELRTPLNAILGFSELMRLQNQRALGDALAPIDNIHASGQRLLATIEGLLSQADHGAGAFDIHKQRLKLCEALKESVDEMHAETVELCCGLDLCAGDDLEIDADPRALKQMISVLLSYPLRFIGPETRISVSCERAGTDTVVKVKSSGLINAVEDDRDKIETQLVGALALAHGARLHIEQLARSGRSARLTFFATHAVH